MTQALTPPSTERLMAVLDATWPPAETLRKDGWLLRRGAGGGQRVSAASGAGDASVAEDAMRVWGQRPLFRLGPSESETDRDLESLGYRRHDPTVFYVSLSERLAGGQSHVAAAYTCEFRPAIIEEIWSSGGIGAGRLAVMDRADGPSSFLMSRADDRPAGVAFVAVDGDVAMIHAIEVLDSFRRKGAAVLLMEAAARFAMEHAAPWLALAVTEANAPARALYARLGMVEAGGYHYRLHSRDSA